MPNIGTGMAEEARKKLKRRKKQIDDAIDAASGSKKNVQQRVQDEPEVRVPVNPPGLEKTKEEGDKELEALREKQRKRNPKNK